MAKYDVDLINVKYTNTSTEGEMVVWKGRVKKSGSPESTQDKDIERDEKILRENKDVAIQDIHNRLRRYRVNFDRDEVILGKTKERITNEEHLLNKLSELD